MTLTYEHTPGRVQMKEDGVAFFDTDYYPIMLGPSTTEVTGLSVVFPDVVKGIAYGFARGVSGGGSDLYRSCHSLATMGPQEWGPASMIPPADDPSHVLSEAVITTVPAACDGLIVQFRVTRTDNPSLINGNTIPVLPKQGEWVMAPGGSLPIEYLFPLSRQIDVVLQTDAAGDPVYNLDGSRNVVLQRRQSVNRRRYGFYQTDEDNSGWTAHGTPGRYGHIVYSIEAKGPAFTVGDGYDFSYNGSNPCSLVDTSDYSSTYSVDVRVAPVYLNEAPTNSGASTKIGFCIGQLITPESAVSGGQSVFTFDSLYMGAEHPTRHAYVFVCIRTPNTSPATNLTEFSINGTVVSPMWTTKEVGLTWGLYALHVPTGDYADMELTLDRNSSFAYCAAFMSYNMDNPLTPVNLFLSQRRGTNTSDGTLVDLTGGAIVFCAAGNNYVGPYPSGGGWQPGFVGMGFDFDLVNDPIYSTSLAGWSAVLTPPSTSVRMKALIDVDASGGDADTDVWWMAMVLN